MRTVLLSLIFFVMACAPSHANACPSGSAEISTTPIIEQTPRRLAKAKEFAQATGDTDVLIIGDSIAEGWAKTQARDFLALSVTNMGLAGEKTQELRWRLKEYTPKINPKRIVLIIGTNNLREQRYSPCEVYGGISAVSKDLKNIWPNARLFVMQLLPRGPKYKFRADDRASINEMLADNVDGAKLVRIDESAITCIWSAKGCQNYKPDNLHPVASGYVILRQALAKDEF